TAPVMSLLLGGIVAADLWMLTLTYYPASTLDKYYPTTSFISQVQSLVPATERIIMEGRVMPANTGLILNVRDWRYQDPMFSKRALNASKLLAPGYDKDGWAYYNMFFPTVKMEVAPAFGIRYVIYPAATNPASWEPFPDRPDFKRLAFKDGLGLYEIQDVPGFTYLSNHVVAVAGEPEVAHWLEDMTWAKIRSYPAVVEAPVSAISDITTATSGSSPGNTNVTDYTSGHIVIKTDAQRSALLVVSESYYPGWHATLDGQPVEILRTNYRSQGVVVPAGKHTIEMKYEPDSFRNGVLLSVAGLVGLGGLFVWSRRKPRPQAVETAAA
ncbi:MAG: YfhO family protein, partial [Chloroflexia bacterium]